MDTDLIIPARHLKTLSRVGLGRHAFEALRESEDNIFEAADYRHAPILIAGTNFGCGSSREHAAWALLDLGIRAVIAVSFADIFSSNAFKNGIATIELADHAIAHLLGSARDEMLVDLNTMTVTAVDGRSFSFSMDAFRRKCLLEGLDEIDLTLEHEAFIEGFEQANLPQVSL